MASDKKPAQAGGHHHLTFAENLMAGGLAGVGTFVLRSDCFLFISFSGHRISVQAETTIPNFCDSERHPRERERERERERGRERFGARPRTNPLF